MISESKDIDFCTDADFPSVAIVEARNQYGSVCEGISDYEFDVMTECKIDLEISCVLTEGTYAGEDCRTMAKWSPDGCLTVVEYTYRLSNIGTEDLTITRLESVLNGEAFDVLEGAEIADVILLPNDLFNVRRNVTLEACKDIQYILTGAVSAISSDGQECEDVDDFAIDIPPPFSTAELSSLTPAPTSSSSGGAIVISTPGVSATASASSRNFSFQGSDMPSNEPSSTPSDTPSTTPSEAPSKVPSNAPSAIPSDLPSGTPSARPSSMPSVIPSRTKSKAPSDVPSIAMESAF